MNTRLYPLLSGNETQVWYPLNLGIMINCFYRWDSETRPTSLYCHPYK